MAVTSLLLIEDDDRIRASLSLALEDEGYAVTGAPTAERGLTAFSQSNADVVLVDLMLPGISGFDCIRELRKRSAVPIVVVSAREDTHDIVVALEAGADDYVVKPVAVKELSARIRAVQRRLAPADTPSRYEVGDLVIDPAAGEVRLAGRDVRVTSTEFKLLCVLAAHAGQVLSRQQLLALVWDTEYGDARVVDVHVGRLRRKVEHDPTDPQHVLTLRGLGYKLR